MELYPRLWSAKEKFDLELARRSPNSAFIFGLVAAFTVIFDFGDDELFYWNKANATLLLIVSMVRYFSAKKLMSLERHDKKTAYVLYSSVVLNALFWTIITTPIYYMDKFVSVACYIATCITAGFSAGAAASLAPVRKVGITAQSMFLAFPILAGVALAVEHRNPFYLTVVGIYLLLWIHAVKTLNQNHRDIQLAMDFEVSMIKSNEELKESREKLAAETVKLIHTSRMASLGEMAGGIAHEVNNPLFIMQGYVEHIKRQANKVQEADVAQKISEKADQISKTIQRIANIVKGLRLFSQQSDRMPMEPSSFKSIMDETMEFSSEKLRTNHIEFRVSFPQDVYLHCRHVQISQVLINMINNSFDAVEKLEERWIELKATVEGDKLVILFRDSGHGISPELQQKLFQPFFTTKEVGKGTGLGLSITSGIIGDHGGTIRYNPEDKHTSFTIELPLKVNTAKIAA